VTFRKPTLNYQADFSEILDDRDQFFLNVQAGKSRHQDAEQYIAIVRQTTDWRMLAISTTVIDTTRLNGPPIADICRRCTSKGPIRAKVSQMKHSRREYPPTKPHQDK
jgi:hypothetical protein